MRFDGETHSSILMDGVVNLSYSYMTFLMQSVDDMENDDYQFDLEEYNYLINKRTALHDKDLIIDTSSLAYVLKNLHQIDPQLLEMLSYYYKPEDDDVDIYIMYGCVGIFTFGIFGIFSKVVSGI